MGEENKEDDEMARKTVLVAVIFAAFIAPTQAGEIKVYAWPAQYVPQELTTVPVQMDIGYYVAILNQNDLRIKLRQVSIKDYEGCVDVEIRANFDLSLSCSIAATGTVPGDYSCSITPANLNIPGGKTQLCAKLTNANLALVLGGTVDVHVADVTIKVTPRFY